MTFDSSPLWFQPDVRMLDWPAFNDICNALNITQADVRVALAMHCSRVPKEYSGTSKQKERRRLIVEALTEACDNDALMRVAQKALEGPRNRVDQQVVNYIVMRTASLNLRKPQVREMEHSLR